MRILECVGSEKKLSKLQCIWNLRNLNWNFVTQSFKSVIVLGRLSDVRVSHFSYLIDRSFDRHNTEQKSKNTLKVKRSLVSFVIYDFLVFLTAPHMWTDGGQWELTRSGLCKRVTCLMRSDDSFFCSEVCTKTWKFPQMLNFTESLELEIFNDCAARASSSLWAFQSCNCCSERSLTFEYVNGDLSHFSMSLIARYRLWNCVRKSVDFESWFHFEFHIFAHSWSSENMQTIYLIRAEL